MAPVLMNPEGAYVRGSALVEESEENAIFSATLSSGKNPLGLPDTTRVGLEQREQRRVDQSITRQEAEEAGWSRAEMLTMNDQAWDAGRMALHIKAVKHRGLEFYYHVGTNDNVSPGLAELGRTHPDFPVFIVPGGQHGGPPGIGYTLQTTDQPEVEENLYAFAVHHFRGARSLPMAPRITVVRSQIGNSLTVTASFPVGVETENNRLFWCRDRHRPYTYAAEYDRWESVAMMRLGATEWQAVLSITPSAQGLDFITTHRHVENGLPFNVSSSYHQVP